MVKKTGCVYKYIRLNPRLHYLFEIVTILLRDLFVHANQSGCTGTLPRCHISIELIITQFNHNFNKKFANNLNLHK